MYVFHCVTSYNEYLLMRRLDQVKQIDILPDDVLLEIFGFIRTRQVSKVYKHGNRWSMFVDNGESVVLGNLGSPRRLNLQLCCTPEKLARDTLDVWPALPLIVEGNMSPTSRTDNIIAVLEQINRVREISLGCLASWKLEEVLVAMEVSFPELIDLGLSSYDEILPAIPDLFLGGSASRLR